MTLLSCRNKLELVDLSENVNDGKCIYSALNDTLSKYTYFEEAFTIEVISPTFEEELKKYSMSDLKDLETAQNIFSIPIQQKHTIFLLKDNDQTSILKPYSDGFMACKVEVPTKLKEFTLEKLEEKSYEVKVKTLVSSAKLIKKHNSFEGLIRTDSIMSFKEGYYSPILEAVAGGYERQMDFVFKLQRKLIEKGLNLRETGIFDEETTNAVLEFQRNNNLSDSIFDKRFFEVLDFDGNKNY